MSRLRTRILALVIVFGFVTASTSLLAGAKEDPFVYFPETRHYLRQPFLDYFKANGGLFRFGYPITEAFVDPKTRLLVQYFQKGRLELHPTHPDPYKIQLGLLNEELGNRTPPLQERDIPSPNDPNCTYFPETHHSVCYTFLQFWHKAGGLDMFGYPISEFIFEGDRIVQYFQRATFEWDASQPSGQQVRLTAIGELYARTGAVPTEELAPESPPSEILGTTPTRITARGAPLNAVVKSGGIQSAYVLVLDQLARPVADAAVELIVHYWQPGTTSTQGITYQLEPTNQDGASFQEFPAGVAPDGVLITIEFVVTYPGRLPFRTPASYMIFGK